MLTYFCHPSWLLLSCETSAHYVSLVNSCIFEHIYIADTCDPLPIEEIYCRYFRLTPFVCEYNSKVLTKCSPEVNFFLLFIPFPPHYVLCFSWMETPKIKKQGVLKKCYLMYYTVVASVIIVYHDRIVECESKCWKKF